MGSRQLTSDRWLRAWSFIVFFMVWHALAVWLDTRVLPDPISVGRRIVDETLSFDLPFHLAWTLGRVFAAFVLAMLLGTVIGILMGRYRRVDLFLDGWLTLGLNIPALVTIILCYIWIGLTGIYGDIAAVTAVALNKIPTVVVTVREGARAVDRELLQVAQAFHLPPRRTLTKVYLPQLYPYLMAAARTGLALIWKIVLVVELIGRSNGVGFRLSEFFSFFDITGILAYTAVFATVVLLIEARLMRPIDRKLAVWR